MERWGCRGKEAGSREGRRKEAGGEPGRGHHIARRCGKDGKEGVDRY